MHMVELINLLQHMAPLAPQYNHLQAMVQSQNQYCRSIIKDVLKDLMNWMSEGEGVKAETD